MCYTMSYNNIFGTLKNKTKLKLEMRKCFKKACQCFLAAPYHTTLNISLGKTHRTHRTPGWLISRGKTQTRPGFGFHVILDDEI